MSAATAAAATAAASAAASSSPSVSVAPYSISIPSWLLPWWTYLYSEYTTSPHHLVIEIALLIFVIYLFTSKSYDPKKGQALSPREEDELIAEWTPLPLTPALPANVAPRPQHIVDSVTGAYVVVDGKKRLNWASTNFLGLADKEEVKSASRATIDRYGVGSCGPRGFYGSFDKHLDMEAALAQFMGTAACVLYSDGIACVSSVIPAFSKRGDLIVCDSGCNYGIQQGVTLSRSNALYFKHNDMADLERTLAEVEEKERRRPPAKLYRKFIVVEGLYQYHGTIAPLRRLIELKQKYKYRIILDDSMAFGVLGATGRGSAEHAGVPITEIDIVCATMDHSLATVGGFCVGTKQVVDHQRLAGAGYCFSAAAPPYTCTAGLVTLDLLNREPSLCSTVRNKAARMRSKLADIPGVTIVGDDFSPVIPIRLSPSSSTGSVIEDRALLESVSSKLWNSDIALLVPDYIPTDRSIPPPALRMLVTSLHSDADIDRTAIAIKQAFAEVLRRK